MYNKSLLTPKRLQCIMEKKGSKALVKYLVEHGADIQEENWKYETPLFNACRNRNEPIVNYLVDLGADLNKENRDGDTSLFIAFIACSKGRESIIQYLIEHGADINKENEYGMTPFFQGMFLWKGNHSKIFGETWCRYI
ncbi:hypothetical protein PIROE2DRAFT_64555 [Piromyces sp. E2]|nr:hypothetical protein PIROE2DRAFT_64555 [Piromyces sp. E2]|eukprot:OUM58235.1 hypothetical protein PIROE2DRAFT_64555 [Piromyces sp. E2]